MNWKLRCFDIDYYVGWEDVENNFKVPTDLDDDDLDNWYDLKVEEIKASLPKQLIVTVEADEDDLEDVVVDAISEETGWLVNSYEYEIIDAWSDDEDFNDDEDEEDKQLGYFDIEVEILEKDGVKMVYIANDGSSGVKYTLNDTDTKEHLKHILHDYVDDLVDYEL